MYFMGVGSRSVADILSGRRPYVVRAWKLKVDAIMIDVKSMSVAVLVVTVSLCGVGKRWSNDIISLAVVVVVALIAEQLLLITKQLMMVTERLLLLILSAAKVTILLSVAVVRLSVLR